MRLLPYIFSWFALIPIAIANGVLREKTYGAIVSELTAHQISCVTALVLFYLAFLVVFRCWPLQSRGHAVVVGTLWLVSTVAFEFVFGRFVAGHSWERLLHDYNLLVGRLWILVLLGIFLAPLIFFRFGATLANDRSTSARR